MNKTMNAPSQDAPAPTYLPLQAALESIPDTELSQLSMHASMGTLSRGFQWKRHILLLLISLCVLYVIIDSLTSKNVEAITISFLEWVENHPLQGFLGVIVVYIFATICFVPGSILTLGTGYAFHSAYDSVVQGVAVAATAVFLGASLGSICSFLLGRYMFRDAVNQLAARYPIFRAVDQALEHNGLKIMILLRLSPLIPFNALDYISGITSISLKSYSLALIAIIPGTIMFCYIGATASSLLDGAAHGQHGGIQTISLISGCGFAVAGVAAVSYYSKRELDKILSNDESEESQPTVLSTSSRPTTAENLTAEIGALS